MFMHGFALSDVGRRGEVGRLAVGEVAEFAGVKRNGLLLLGEMQQDGVVAARL